MLAILGIHVGFGFLVALVGAKALIALGLAAEAAAQAGTGIWIGTTSLTIILNYAGAQRAGACPYDRQPGERSLTGAQWDAYQRRAHELAQGAETFYGYPGRVQSSQPARAQARQPAPVARPRSTGPVTARTDKAREKWEREQAVRAALEADLKARADAANHARAAERIRQHEARQAAKQQAEAVQRERARVEREAQAQAQTRAQAHYQKQLEGWQREMDGNRFANETIERLEQAGGITHEHTEFADRLIGRLLGRR